MYQISIRSTSYSIRTEKKVWRAEAKSFLKICRVSLALGKANTLPSAINMDSANTDGRHSVETEVARRWHVPCTCASLPSAA